MRACVHPEMQPLAEPFAAAAGILAGGATGDASAMTLLRQLDYLDGLADQAAHRCALLQAASGFKRIFTLRADDAPGLVALGAEVIAPQSGETAGVSGTGLTVQQAFESCVGEGVEYLSQFLTPADEIERRDGSDWAKAADLADGGPVPVPADICFRRPEAERAFTPPWPLSTGCGAGKDALEATLHGLLELIERDAVALWWRGGMRGRLLPAGCGGVLLSRLRRTVTRRRTWLLDITSDIGIPVVVAAAANADGRGLCVGHAARPTLAGAADAALMELTQMELAHQISAAKRATNGDAALNATDRRHIHRYTVLAVADLPALHPLAPPNPPDDLPACDRLATLAAIRHGLQAVGLAAAAINLTRPAYGIPVVRALCPGLELGLTAPPGPRLTAAAARTGTDLSRADVL